MKKISTILLCMLLTFAMHLHAGCPTAKLVRSSDKICSEGTVTITAQGVSPTDYDFRWKISGGTFVSGFGSNEIKVKWSMGGEKFITLTYQKKDGCLVEGNISVNVISTSGVGGLAVTKDSLCEGEKIQVQGTPAIHAPNGIYKPGIWTLNGSPIDINTYEVKAYDNGKYLRREFKSTVDYCSNVFSNPVQVLVKTLPLFREISVNGKSVNPRAEIGETVTLSANVASQSPLKSVIWYLNNQEIGTGGTISHTVKDASYLQTIKVDAVNACGKVSSDRMVYKNTNDMNIPSDPNLILKGTNNSEDFMVHPTNTPSVIPFPSINYWESDQYLFWTTNQAYDNGDIEWLVRNEDGSWDISKPGVGYEFTVRKFTTWPGVWGEVSQVGNDLKASWTLVIDEGTYLHTFAAANTVKLYNATDRTTVLGNIGFNGNGVGFLSLNNGLTPIEYANVTGTRQNLKVFGMKPGRTIIKVMPENCKLDANYNVDISPNNGACENFVIDFNGAKMVSASPYRDCGLGIQHGGGSFVVRNITVKNVSHETLDAGDVFSAVKIYNFKNGNGFRYIENIKVDNTVLESTKKADVAAFGIAGASSVYLKNLTSNAVLKGERAQDVLFLKHHVYSYPADGQWGPFTGPTEINNIAFDGLSTLTNKLGITSLYKETGEKTIFPDMSNIEIPAGYRYFNITTGQYPRIEILKSLPEIDTTKVVYDIAEGCYIIRSEANLNPQFLALRDFYTMVPVTDGAPRPNIKVSANANGVINSFTLPDLNTVSDVNLIFTKTALTPALQNGLVPVAKEAIIGVKSAGTKQINLFNLDFATVADYAAIDIAKMFPGIGFGSLYNCKVADYLKGEYMIINKPYSTTGIENVTAKAAVVTYPNPFDNEVQISSEYTILSVKIADLSGSQVYTGKVGATSVTIPAGSWNAGAYIVVIETANGNYVDKIVKK